MIKNCKKRAWSLVLVFALLVGLVAPSASANGVETIRYLSLGDSLAAGMTPEKGISSGYSDMTADYLKGKNSLATYSKEFAVPGYTTQNVLDDLTVKSELREAVKQANLITISAGANDLLKIAKLDAEKNILILDPAAVKSTLQTLAKNYTMILQTIKELNPNASVYVMGYYYPFPYLSDAQKPQLIELTKTLNQTIQLTISEGATFVQVYDKFGDDTKKYLPNPENIHPNQEGYKLMSDALIEMIAKPKPTANDLPKGHWAEKELNMLLANKILNVDERGNIYPEKPITRAEVAGILYNSIPMTKSIPANPGYKDVPETHPAYMAIAKLTEAGVFTKAEYFNPNAPLTRVQLAKVIGTAFQLKGDSSAPTYKDTTASYWGTPYINAMTTNKIMLGYKNGKFGVNDSTNRAQFAVVLARVQALKANK
ncbi:S-layer homology domain-containing protein [Bacillus cihuensis]|uniref:S-layer homology domain-containing protein n=1 Tax=Bacillus cihuensis TaxID=1208599 RepID=UPI00041E0CE0|nr:S-layer homology domain-containing protein [Bacillus cihuensis]